MNQTLQNTQAMPQQSTLHNNVNVGDIDKEQPNLLIQFATPLFNLMTQIRHTTHQKDVEKFQLLIIEEVKRFQQKLVDHQYPQRTIIAARYCLCTAMDEAVLAHSWGSASIWSQRSLLSLFHKETWGGERFYIIIEDMARDSRGNIDFLEFAYFLLSLGFEGKFFNKLEVREEIRNRVFYRIRNARLKPDKAVTHLRSDDVMDKAAQVSFKSKIKRLFILTVSCIVISGLYYNYKVYDYAKPIVKKMDSIADTSPVTSFSQVIKRPIVQRGDDG